MPDPASPDLSNLQLTLLGFVGLAAGTVDTIAGGGGLLTLPALISCGLPLNLAMATNKGQSVFGSGTALARFARSHLFDPRRALLSFLPALLGASAGVGLLILLQYKSPNALRPLIITLLTSVALFMIFYRPPHNRPPLKDKRLWAAIPIAFLIAAYDGFFGPGTGTFLILAYALVFHDPLDRASANAKLVNFCSNLASFIAFALQGWIIWKVALPMALGQMTGALLGAHITLRKGKSVVRYVAVAVCLGLIAKVAWDFTHR
jgi:uncharacterized membrane protein YfcA